MDNKILIRPTECIQYLGISQASFYRYKNLGLLVPDGYGKRNQPMFYQETLDTFCQEHGVKPGNINSPGKSSILDKVARPKEDETHHTGAIIHWGERYRGGSNNTYVPITCAVCTLKFDKMEHHLIPGIKDGSFTGCCPNCYRAAKRQSKLKTNGRTMRRGYVLRHKLTFAPEEWDIISSMSIGRDYVIEHRAVVALGLGRPLVSTEVVHHRNGVKTDNSPDNLVLMEQKDHQGLHSMVLSKLVQIEGLVDRVKYLEDQLALLMQKIV